MSYETELRADADRYSDMRNAGEELAAAEHQVREEIRIAFTVTLLKYSSKVLAVPAVDYHERIGQMPREVGTTVAEAITDTVQGGEVDDELLAVLDHSSCPHVQALREAIAASWAKRNAADVASCRVEA